jgi:hypothetical protein
MSWHDGFSYHEALARCWESGDTVLNVEWDMEHSRSLMLGLLACPHSLCTYAYMMHLPTKHYAHGDVSAVPAFRERGEGVRWIERGDEWASYSGIGFCKIALGARVGELERQSWPLVELAVNRAVRGPWHVHWHNSVGIEHHHRTPRATS